MDLAELSQRTGKDRRKLRYVIDHALIPDFQIEIVDDEVGRPRKFHNDVGFVVFCAVLLLDIGLAHESIRTFFRALSKIKDKSSGELMLLRVLLEKRPAFADFADLKWVRLRVGETASPWHMAGAATTARNIQPNVVVTLNFGQLRDTVFPR